MEKDQFIYNAIKILFSVMVQSTIAIENYFNVTIEPFNKNILQFYEKWISYYDRTVEASLDNISGDMRDAILLHYLRTLKERNIKTTLEYFDKNIIQKIGVTYNVISKFSEYDNNNSISNPFEQIIIDLRKLSEDKFNEKEVSEVNSDFVLWYDSSELELIRENRKSLKNIDGELGGHLMQKRVSNDMSYLINNDEAERLFQETVLGVVSSAQ